MKWTHASLAVLAVALLVPSVARAACTLTPQSYPYQASATKVERIAASGTAAQKIDLLVVAEGFPSESDFRTGAHDLFTLLLGGGIGPDPFAKNRSAFNVVTAFIPSRVAPTGNAQQDTPFQSRISQVGQLSECGTQFLFGTDAAWAGASVIDRAEAASGGTWHAGEQDAGFVIVLINNPNLGGGIAETAPARHVLFPVGGIGSPGFIAHELAHGAADLRGLSLADEYTQFGAKEAFATSLFPPGGETIASVYANCTADVDPANPAASLQAEPRKTIWRSVLSSNPTVEANADCPRLTANNCSAPGVDCNSPPSAQNPTRPVGCTVDPVFGPCCTSKESFDCRTPNPMPALPSSHSYVACPTYYRGAGFVQGCVKFSCCEPNQRRPLFRPSSSCIMRKVDPTPGVDTCGDAVDPALDGPQFCPVCARVLEEYFSAFNGRRTDAQDQWIRDNLRDLGFEPSADGIPEGPLAQPGTRLARPWHSDDIKITGPDPNGDAVRGVVNTVEVTARNRGVGPGLPTQVRVDLFAANATIGAPPWPDATQTNWKLVGTKVYDNVNLCLGTQTMVFDWSVPQDQYQHSCLIAHLTTDTDNSISGTNVYDNARNNNGVGWRNLNVVDATAAFMPGMRADMGNYGATSQTMQVIFDATVLPMGTLLLLDYDSRFGPFTVRTGGSCPIGVGGGTGLQAQASNGPVAPPFEIPGGVVCDAPGEGSGPGRSLLIVGVDPEVQATVESVFEAGLVAPYTARVLLPEGTPPGDYFLSILQAVVENGTPHTIGGVSYMLPVGVNHAPDCSRAYVDPASLWPPDGRLQPVVIAGISDLDHDELSVQIVSVRQDEPVGRGGPDAEVLVGAEPPLLLRAERAPRGDGRIYHVAFTAVDPDGASCSSVVAVCVSHDQHASGCGDGGPLYLSTQ